MSLKVWGAAFAAAAMVAAPMAAAAQAKQDFSLRNRTGYTIAEVYVSPTSADDWEEDVLGKDVLNNGDTTNIHFARAEKTCKWDLKVVYDDEDEAEWESFDLCKVSRITILYDRKSGDTSAEYE